MKRNTHLTTRREFVRDLAAGAEASSLMSAVAAKSVNISAVVSPEWLSTNLGDPKLVVIDIRSADRYKKGHIPGSVNVSMSSWAVSRNGLSLELPPEIALRDLLSAAGIDAASRVVVVNTTESDFSRADPMRVAWTLAVCGIENTAVLDGGYGRWLKEIKSVSTEIVSPKPSPYTLKTNKSIAVPKEYVLQRIGKSVIVDSRVPEDYFGITSKTGHISTSVNLPAPWAFNEDGTLKKVEELQAMASGVIVSGRSKEVITYCGVGGFAAAWWFILTRICGYGNVKVYDGSMEEWERDPKAPVSRYGWH